MESELITDVLGRDQEQAVVTDIDGTTARVRIVKRPECGPGCACAERTSGTMDLAVPVVPGLAVGHHVVVSTGARMPVRATLALFVVPMVGFVVGLTLAFAVGARFGEAVSREVVSVAGGFVGMGLAFGLVRLYERLLLRRGTLNPHIVSIIRERI